MEKLGNVARIITRPAQETPQRVIQTQNRGSRNTVPYAEFEPLAVQIRHAINARSNNEIARAIGYASGTQFAEWRRNGAPLLAKNAAIGLLALHGVNARVPVKRQFESDELIAIMCAVSRLPDTNPDRSVIIKRLAREL